MTTVYTTLRCISVKESYELIAQCLERKEQELIELTEVIVSTSDFPNFDTIRTERKVLIQTQYIVEVIA